MPDEQQTETRGSQPSLEPEQERLLQSERGAQQLVPRQVQLQATKPPAQPEAAPPPLPPAPDGGWGWLVAVAVAFICTVTIGPAMAAPFVFADYLEEIGQGSQGMTTLLSIWMAVSSFSGLLCNKLFQRFSCRQVGWLGAFFLAIAQGPLAIATRFSHFILANISGGLGMGLVVTACFTSFNIYFNRRKTLAMGVTQLIMGLGMFGFPIIVQEMVEHLGFRMAQCVICAINISIIPVLAIMKPLKSKVREASPEDSASTQVIDCSQAASNSRRADFPKSLSLDHINEKMEGVGGQEGDKSNASLNHLTYKHMTSATDRKHDDENQESSFHGSAGRLSSLTQHQPLSANSMAAPSVASRRFPRSWLSTVVDTFDLTLLQDFTIANTLVGLSLMFFVDMMFMTVIPLHLFHTDLPRSDAAKALSVMTFADMGGRLSIAILGACGVTKNRMLFLLGSSACIFFRTLYIFLTDFTSVAVLSALSGVSRSYITGLMPLVIGETCSKQRFPAAYGLHSVMAGVLYIVVGPLIGLLKDRTSNFVASIITLDVIALLCIIPWILEMAIMYKRKQEKLALDT